MLPALTNQHGSVQEVLVDLLDLAALQDVVSAREGTLRDDLRDQADQVAAMTGTAFTARAAGIGQAILTDPQPKARLVDADEFVRDAETYVQVIRAYVAKPVPSADWATIQQAAHAIVEGDHADPDAVLQFALLVKSAVRTVDDWMTAGPVADELDALVSNGTIRLLPNGAWWTTGANAGDQVAGVEVSTAKPTLQVRLDGKARKRRAAEVREALGMQALDG